MPFFDATKNWVISAPRGARAIQQAAEDLSRCIALLGGRDVPVIVDIAAPISGEHPLIILNKDSGVPRGRGFSWSAALDRIEIIGQGEGGVCKGVYDFLSALGISWPGPDSQALMRNPGNAGVYSLDKSGNTCGLSPEDEKGSLAGRKRLVIRESSKALRIPKRRAALFQWAVQSGFDAVVFPFHAAPEAFAEARGFGLCTETGGWVMSLLLPRKFFLFHRDLFRMEGGRRKKKVHFCPTNPDTIALIRAEGKKLFSQAGETDMFHIWPDKGEEKNWCSCPSCRAFTRAEQNRIAVNAAADALAEKRPGAFLSYYEDPEEPAEIPLRLNIARIDPAKISDAEAINNPALKSG